MVKRTCGSRRRRDEEPFLASLAGSKSQVCWCSGSDDDREEYSISSIIAWLEEEAPMQSDFEFIQHAIDKSDMSDDDKVFLRTSLWTSVKSQKSQAPRSITLTLK